MANKSKVIDKAIFLDLDGVLFDTLKEAYCVSTLATTNKRSIGSINFESEHFKIFKKYRFLINCATDYYDLLKAIDKKSEDRSIDIARDFRLHCNIDSLEKQIFEKRFLKARRYIRVKYPKFWLSLNTPYNFLYKISEIIKEAKPPFFIITTKDKDTVLQLLKVHKVNFSSDNIYDGKYYKRFNSKGGVVKFIIDKYRVRKSLIIDDSRDHLCSCGGITGLVRIHAGWGYVLTDNNSECEKEAIYKIKKILGA
ncbi:MAG: hypothetical protein PHC54_00905 [Candidatus Omnitrophica bacterium]|nr:hypothetical protein [Candidatus Omnitrophota bacterium]MDD5591862.1 hypothetical protein [Candidatus Omnitrophota bacterium]